MSKSLTIGLIIIFLIHFGVFLTLYLKRKQFHHLIFVGAFTLLIVYQALRLWWPDLTLWGQAAYTYFRVGSWIVTFIGLLAYIRFKFSPAKGHS